MTSSRYAAAHADPQGAGDARPTAMQIIEDEGLREKLGGKVIVITGATSGIGAETARALSTTGARLILTARNLESAEKSTKDMLKSGRVSLVQMDHNSLESVRKAGKEIVARSNGKVNLLIGNAGVMGIQERTLTEDGHEMHFQTNFLAHFLLFQLLKDALLSAAAPDFNSRVVIVGSASHRSVTLPTSDNYDFEKSNYEYLKAYSQSNLAKTYLANEINRRYSTKGLFANSLHPGGINTNIGRNVGPEVVKQIMENPFIKKVLKSPEQGAATTVLAAVAKEWGSKGGRYLEDCKESERGEDDGNGFGAGWVKQTFDAKEEARLWKDSLVMVGMGDDA